ncbi:MAG: hypothetical protein WBA74_19380 [Cyclobacteriaceae bacterium]
MRNTIFLIVSIGIFLGFSACDDDEVKAGATISAMIFENAKLDENTGMVIQGNQIVLQYSYSDPKEELATDAGVAYQLLLEIPANNATAMQINKSDLENIRHHYTQSCFCIPITSSEITDLNLQLIRYGNDMEVSGLVALAFNEDHRVDSNPYLTTVTFENTYFRSGSNNFR